MLYLLDPDNPAEGFPDPEKAERDPDGLLAIGGDLSPARLLDAYRHGIFPWFNEEQPILWWSPDPRTVLFPDRVAVSRSLRKTLRRGHLETSFDLAFGRIIRSCAGPRPDAPGTWILPAMVDAYEALHASGQAHSVEVWEDGDLVGGLYGVSIGKAFFGESMFNRARDASKVALVALCRRLSDWDFAVIDCQVRTEHLIRMGAQEIPRQAFLTLLARACSRPHRLSWRRPRQPTAALADAG
jgi:leucyl/phenylalanyl-tRNA--protein transferase